ncbi:hypothetical protein KJZ71_02630 [Patescibacteria group bacterium]|uniref:Uncharacterized protein n=1 Tax=candidate division WWE3 bacterium TaxID=2053526 RepID=A0A928TWJ3_UNCKA|nr:hypothetical protein [candidate division WWE3 bacterium]MCL4732681.1 hypothetical protein [Patescibacteria group bacterium]
MSKKMNGQEEDDLELAGYTADIFPPPRSKRLSSSARNRKDDDSRWGEEARYEHVVSEEAARSRPSNRLP